MNPEVQSRIHDLSERLSGSGGIFEVARLEEELAELDREMQKPGFWDDPEASAPVVRRRKSVERRFKTLEQLRSDASDLEAWQELLAEGEDESEAEAFLVRVDRDLARLELELKLSGPDDEKPAIVAIHPGAGGTESQDWAEMLLRMYLRWAEQNDYDVELLDRLEGEEAGIKSATFAVRGEYAYGYLKGEAGVHRLVRISPYDAQSRRHTSFASVDVYPEIDDDVEIGEILDKDLRIDTYRSSGAGGQHVNKTESAVRITHLPTNIVVACQQERSQFKNRATAMKMLRSKLYDREMQRRADEQAEREGAKSDNAWGNQIRSYVLQPYRMVKDHRTGAEVGDADRVLDGDIEPFIQAWLTQLMDDADKSSRGQSPMAAEKAAKATDAATKAAKA
ncbi:MAG TPA: peptide chain release factor 2 [Thermoanaerobaculia bacterium]|nr:peptide chain release factor 2 [Thermoanaerobaculia bacterium]